MRIVNPIGKKGEDLAVEFLRKKGYKIIERNFRKGYGEIDIIAVDPSVYSGSKNPILVFFEVKTRTSEKFGTPFESITSWKLRQLLKTAEYYSHSHKNLPCELRVDAIAVVLDSSNNLVSIEHMENISGF